MALVKKTALTANSAPGGKTSAVTVREAEAQRKKARTLAKQQQAAERIAAATGQLASGIAEASSAAEELKRASDQIATGAEEASSAAQESLAAFQQVGVSITRQMQNADVSRAKGETCQALIVRTSADVAGLITNIGVAAQRQTASVRMVSELETQAANIGDIVKAVARIADQTNLLALNAAIEAARAGKHGKGFAVVADEVRTLAETSEKSAKQIQDLVGQIQTDVKTIAGGINTSAKTMEDEVEKGKLVTIQLEQIRLDAIEIVKGIGEIAANASQSNVASQQALKGSQSIAAAAEEQSSAAEESGKTVAEQTQALAECEQAAQALSELAEDLKNSTDVAKSAEQVASSSEELSSPYAALCSSSAREEISSIAAARSSAPFACCLAALAASVAALSASVAAAEICSIPFFTWAMAAPISSEAERISWVPFSTTRMSLSMETRSVVVLLAFSTSVTADATISLRSRPTTPI